MTSTARVGVLEVAKAWATVQISAGVRVWHTVHVCGAWRYLEAARSTLLCSCKLASDCGRYSNNAMRMHVELGGMIDILWSADCLMLQKAHVVCGR